MDLMADSLSVKNLLFTRAIPNYVIPIPVNGHKVYPCTDCGDKFLFESSLTDHVNRISAKITYMCRFCNYLRVFNNRCNLISHIRSHAFKTATINVTDLQIEPLPLSFFKIKPTTSSSKQPAVPDTSRKPAQPTSEIFCYECKADITVTGIAYKDRASHFMQFTNEVYSCPVCLFALPSVCALKVHLRLHIKYPPYYCPECGIHLANKNVQYPYNHDCEGFKMMRATARLKCAVPDCCLFHPNDYRDHMTKYHLKKVYKCPFCVVACFNETTMDKHLKGHRSEAKALLFYQCDVCPGRYVLQNPKLNDTHLKSHIDTSVFPCWACGSAFKEITNLLTHFIKKHNKTNVIEVALNSILKNNPLPLPKPKRTYRVVKRCSQCKRSFTYKCKYEEIKLLPNECPFKCSSSTMESNVTPEKIQCCNSDDFIICPLCKLRLPQDWGEIKKHYARVHKSHKCLDLKISLPNLDLKKCLNKHRIANATKTKSLAKITKKSRNRPLNKCSKPANNQASRKSVDRATEENELYTCNKCGTNFARKALLEKHLLTHRDPCMAYQCMECGQSFVVKPSFSKHLMLSHGITDVEDYINTKECYNEKAFTKYQNIIVISEETLRENQCKICRDLFEGPEELEKHFRVHGMAFLMKNTSNKNNSSSKNKTDCNKYL